MATAEDVVAYTISTLKDMNFDVANIDRETMIGPSGLDLDSLAVSELAVRIEDTYGVSFPEDEVENLAIMTLGEFADTVSRHTVQAPTESAAG